MTTEGQRHMARVADKAAGADSDRERRRYETAGAAMAAMLGNPALFEMWGDGEPRWLGRRPIATLSVELADALLDELEKRNHP